MDFGQALGTSENARERPPPRGDGHYATPMRHAEIDFHEKSKFDVIFKPQRLVLPSLKCTDLSAEKNSLLCLYCFNVKIYAANFKFSVLPMFYHTTYVCSSDRAQV